MRKGSKVRVKSNEEIKKTLHLTGVHWNENAMKKFCGQTGVITDEEFWPSGEDRVLVIREFNRGGSDNWWVWSTHWIEELHELPEELFNV